LQCKKFGTRLRFDKVTESLKAGTFLETQCRNTGIVNHLTLVWALFVCLQSALVVVV